ncbi:hypothetical protein AABC73_01860 [Pseudomonas sp. G.S.17]|uniref:hypothetical protein n=1 Tax=Pseudomonas sp. G.S.17 TaxID=3137451 RepID=UPI00311CC46E
MAIPAAIPTPPPSPSRADGPEGFSPKADATIAYLPVMVAATNLTVTWMNETIDVVALARAGAVQAADAASQSRIAAAQSAADALAYRNSAQAAAAAAGSAAGLPSLVGNAGKALVVSDDEQSVAFKDLKTPLARLHAIAASGPF